MALDRTPSVNLDNIPLDQLIEAARRRIADSGLSAPDSAVQFARTVVPMLRVTLVVLRPSSDGGFDMLLTPPCEAADYTVTGGFLAEGESIQGALNRIAVGLLDLNLGHDPLPAGIVVDRGTDRSHILHAVFCYVVRRGELPSGPREWHHHMRRPANLSEAMRKAVSLALAVANDPLRAAPWLEPTEGFRTPRPNPQIGHRGGNRPRWGPRSYGRPDTTP
ncbi:MAG TPA: hypothetical protein VMT30_03045 [Candidatus Saccharimonadia bacterium]|nr:hypothetical protein [Candidatus Saccharimonadia bacterium]